MADAAGGFQHAPVGEAEPPGGAMPLDSIYYIERDHDAVGPPPRGLAHQIRIAHRGRAQHDAGGAEIEVARGRVEGSHAAADLDAVPERLHHRAHQILLRGAPGARALEIDPQCAEVRYTKGNLLMLHGQIEQAIDEYRAAIGLNPSFSHAYSRIGLAKLELGRPAEAFEPVLKALRLSPREFRTSLCQFYLGVAAFHLLRDSEATEWLQKAVTTDSRSGLPHAWLAAIYALNRRHADARAELAEFNRLTPGHTIASLRARERSNEPAFLSQRERFYRGLVQAGLSKG